MRVQLNPCRISWSAVTALIALTVGLLAAASPVPAAVSCAKVASPSGSDSAAGTLFAPYRSAYKLANSLTPGQTGCLRGGSYSPTSTSGRYVLSPRRGGSPGTPITIRGYPGERARLVGIVDISNGVDNVTLTDLIFEGTGVMNTIKIYSADVTIQNSEITNAWRGLSCMILGSNSGDGQALRTIVRGNVFHACGNPANGNKDHGIYASNALEAQIVDNIFYDSAAYAIQLYPNAQKVKVGHNVIDGDSPSIRGGVTVSGDSSHASKSNTIGQNIITYSETYNLISSWSGPIGTGNVAASNCFWAGVRGDIANNGGLAAFNNKTANPSFVNRQARDYRLGPNSPCLPVVGYDTAARYSGPIPQ